MSTVHVMQGLPGSGKTTAARRLVYESAGRIRRVALDDLRAMADAPTRAWVQWDPDREKVTKFAQAHLTGAFLMYGHDVVVDSTHLYPGQLQELRLQVSLTPRHVQWRVHSLTDVPLEECLRRNAARPEAERVTEDVIRELQGEYERATAGGWRLTPEWLAGDE